MIEFASSLTPCWAAATAGQRASSKNGRTNQDQRAVLFQFIAFPFSSYCASKGTSSPHGELPNPSVPRLSRLLHPRQQADPGQERLPGFEDLEPRPGHRRVELITGQVPWLEVAQHLQQRRRGGA